MVFNWKLWTGKEAKEEVRERCEEDLRIWAVEIVSDLNAGERDKEVAWLIAGAKMLENYITGKV
jgi:hypothetical protein